MTPTLELVVWLGGFFLTAAVVANTGLLWRIALKVGNVEGKMTFMADKIEEHNDLVQRVTVLEVKEKLRGSNRKDRSSVEQRGGHAAPRDE